MLNNVMSITDTSFNTHLFKSQSWTLLYFWARWSGPCRLLSLFMEHSAKVYGDRLQVLKIDTDLSPALAKYYQVHHVPTLHLLYRGELVDSVEGVLSRPQLEQMLSAHLLKVPVP